MRVLRRSPDVVGRRRQFRALLAVTLALLSVWTIGSFVAIEATRQPDAQIPEATPAAPENRATSLEEARRLQIAADRHIDGKQFVDAVGETEQALAIRRRWLGEMHPDVAYSISRLGIIAYYQGQYEPAEAHLRDALAIRRAVLGPDHVDIAESLNDLASVLQVRGDSVRPASMYEEALVIYQRAIASATPPRAEELQTVVGALLNNLGRLSYTKGDYSRAESYYLKALAIREAKGADDPGVASTLANVGGVYYSWGQFEKAEGVLRRALDIQERRLPANHPAIATSSFNLAAVYFDQGHYRTAEALFQQALAIDEAILDPSHPRLATRLVGLAEVLRLEGEYARADPLYERALSIRERALGPAHPDVAATLIARSLLRYATGDRDAAIELLSRGAELREDTLALVLTTGSEEQKRLYLRTLADETDIAVSLHLAGLPDSAAAARLALTGILRRKGRSIDAMIDQTGSFRRHLDDRDREVLNQLARVQSRLASIALSGVATDEQRQSVSGLRLEIQQLEQNISARSAEFRVASRKATLQSVEAALPDGTALIELFAYRPFAILNARDTAFGAPRYAAYLLRRDGIAGSVDLGDVAGIDQHVRRFRTSLSNPADRGVRAAARALYRDLIQPLQGSLGDVERIIVSPDGALNLVPFAALVEEHDTYLIDHFTISYVTSGRDLTRLRELGIEAPREAGPPVIVANPLFTRAHVTSRASSPKPADTRGLDAEELAETLHFAALPGTAREAAAIAALLPDAHLYTGADASEALLKGLQGPSILHIATHGFFLRPRTPAAGTRQYSTVRPPLAAVMEREDALIRSGLALAGVNQRSSGEGEDGLLTALEVSGLDLWGTRMVVLSACETGVGEARNGEGVYGLRRALVLAGAESQVISLWPVPDAATRELMIAYYQRLKLRQGRAEALRSVQLAMLNGKVNRVHPFYWAGFIESGDWRPAFD